MDRIRAHELALTNFALERLDEKLGLGRQIFGPPPAPTVAACCRWPTGTCTRTTWRRCSTSSACACGRATTAPSRSCAASGVQATARASLSLFSDEHDIEVLIEGLLEAGRLFG